MMWDIWTASRRVAALEQENAELHQRGCDEGKEWLQKCAHYEAEITELKDVAVKLKRDLADIVKVQQARIKELENEIKNLMGAINEKLR